MSIDYTPMLTPPSQMSPLGCMLWLTMGGARPYGCLTSATAFFHACFTDLFVFFNYQLSRVGTLTFIHGHALLRELDFPNVRKGF
jgi:hypothetical protein